ncbi:hypothetical protein [Calothrix sp. NIES-3974]|nr:hypothetical protein [Calothrix sp. NIES-3974]
MICLSVQLVNWKGTVQDGYDKFSHLTPHITANSKEVYLEFI